MTFDEAVSIVRPLLAQSRAAKHTPGPWETNEALNESASGVFALGMKIADCDFISDDPQNQANAVLMAAAPSMLALLQELIAIEGPQPGTSDWATKVRAVIATAIGAA